MQFRDYWQDDVIAGRAFYHMSNESLALITPALVRAGQANGYIGPLHQQWSCWTINFDRYEQLVAEWEAFDEVPDFVRFISLVAALRRDRQDRHWAALLFIFMEQDVKNPHGCIAAFLGADMPQSRAAA